MLRSRNCIYYVLFQCFWLIAILPKFLQLFCLAGLLILIWIREGKEKPLDKFTLMQLVFLLIYGAAIVINAVCGGHALTRILAACNTWGITVVALLFYHIYSNAQLDPRRIGKYSLFNLLVLIAMWLVFRVRGEAVTFSIFSHTLWGPDWVDGMYALRFLGFLDYANLVVFCVLLFYPTALIYLGRHRVLSAALTIALLPVVAATNSRSGILLYLILLMAYALFGVQKLFFRFYRQRKLVLFLLLVSVAAAAAVLLFDRLSGIVNSFLQMREGSNNMRMSIYFESLKRMFTESPLIGIGIKDILPGTEYPYGSHSTYIGVFYKAGILGGSVYLVSIGYMACKTIFGHDHSNYAVVMKLCMVAVLLLMAFEDVDGANWCACLFYILLAQIKSDTAKKECLS